MTYARIIGTGGYLPERELTNADLEKMVDTTDEWILERTGIATRHIMADHETTSSMAQIASEQAIAIAGIEANDLDLILVATSTPDRIFPSTACILQHRLGVTNQCPAFDIAAACAGFVYALSIADQFIRSGRAKTILIAAADSISRIIDWSDRSTCILFSDGAGAVVLQASDTPGILGTHIHADGQFADLLYAPNHLDVLKQPPYIKMQGNKVMKVAVKTLGAIVDETLAANQIHKSDIDWLIPHQANLRIIQATAKQLDMPMEQVILTVQHHGNTSAASIPLALNVGIRDGRVKPGETLIFEAFGGGLTWGSALLKY